MVHITKRNQYGTIFLFFLMFSLLAQAHNHSEHIETLSEEEKKYLTIESVLVEEVEDSELKHSEIDLLGLNIDCSALFPQQNDNHDSNVNPHNFSDLINPIDQADLILDKIINMGKKVWNLVANGRPVVNIKKSIATALPYGSKCWLDLSGWQSPQSSLRTVTYKNLYGWEVVKFSYRIIWLSGGHVNTKGRYIGYATIQPAFVNVKWGFHLNAEATVPSVFNMGTKSDPIGGMLLKLDYRVNSILNVIEEGTVFSITGSGQFKKLN